MSLVAVKEYANAEEMLAAYRARIRPSAPIVIIPIKVEEPRPEPVAIPIPVKIGINTLKRQAREIVIDIAARHGVAFHEVVGVTRFKEVVAARMEACFQIATQIPDLNLSDIARLLNKDHTTVINAIRVWNERTGANVRGLGVVSAERREMLRRSARRSIATGARA